MLDFVFLCLGLKLPAMKRRPTDPKCGGSGPGAVPRKWNLSSDCIKVSNATWRSRIRFHEFHFGLVLPAIKRLRRSAKSAERVRDEALTYPSEGYSPGAVPCKWNLSSDCIKVSNATCRSRIRFDISVFVFVLPAIKRRPTIHEMRWVQNLGSLCAFQRLARD